MAERNKGARRRRAFADFKENQYNDSFSISESQKRKILFKNVFKYIFIVLLTVVFIAVGFIISDALLDISETDYHDSQTYVPKNTTTAESTTVLPTVSTEESTDGDISEESSEISEISETSETSEQ